MTRLPLWTSIVDFRRGTYVRQVRVKSVDEVLEATLRTLLDHGDVPHLTKRKIASAIESLSASEAAAPITGLAGVYCTSVIVGKHLLLVHVVRTLQSADVRTASRRQ